MDVTTPTIAARTRRTGNCLLRMIGVASVPVGEPAASTIRLDPNRSRHSAGRASIRAAIEASEVGLHRLQLSGYLLELLDHRIAPGHASLSLGHEGAGDRPGHDREEGEPAEHHEARDHLSAGRGRDDVA